ncbi:ABC transporter ATP-binding protein [Asanoa sp. NPDC049573]|uniref:ABC transporter ATP-binding protein n=1 Tax=Asanoa sp. NPDC049573 TaxID=3155396 RepID=UPI0034344FDC
MQGISSVMPVPEAADHRQSGSGLEVKDVGIEYYVDRHQAFFRAVENATFTVEAGSFVSIVGPTGCGKSTLLRAIAGLVPYTTGEITWNGSPITVPGRDRAVVFQNPALLPWSTVLRNAAYGAEGHGHARPEADRRAREMLEMVGLTQFVDRYPHELSGGMQQRVNLARALAVDPDVLLLDEPFSALDSQTREVMGGELLRIWEATAKTAVLITHQIDEAVFLSDQVVVLSAGPRSVVKHIVPIALERQRVPEMRRSPEFLEVVDSIWDLTRSAWLKAEDVS